MSNRNDWKTGLSCGAVSPAKLRRAAAANIDCLEVNGIEEGMYWKDVPAWEKNIGVKVQSFHLPFVWPRAGVLASDPSTLDPEIWEQTKKQCVPIIEQAGGEGGIGIFVIHPSLEPNPVSGPERQALIDSSIEHLGYLSDICKKHGAVLAVEDLPRTCLGNTAEELRYIMDANADLRVCFDVNHLLQGDHVSFVKLLADRLITTHISDYDFVDERHLFPREARWIPSRKLATWGQINWGELQKALEDADYKGAWMYEVDMNGHTEWIDIYANRQSLLGL